ncbi:MAG: hypothetical protein JNM39_08610 [Bdellovibrionaceae bacterium]|nr:hypothetical protein [Pseudobdellovibrionaceae bacterium]
MFFKTFQSFYSLDFWKTFGGLLVVSTLVGLLSCTPKVGETPPQVEGQGLKATECLDQAAVGLQKFVKAEATNGEIIQSFDCIHTAFEKFDKYVRGAQIDRYKIAELCEFFENYFLAKDSEGKPKQISQALQIEMMKIKQIFVGGSREDITRAELKKTLDFIFQLKAMALKINPSMSVVTLKWQPTLPLAQPSEVDHFEEANGILQEVIGDLASLIQTNPESTYAMGDFVNLLGRLSEFYRESWPFVGKLETYLPLTAKIKIALIGGEASVVGPKEWSRFLNLGARSYVQYLRYHYFIANNPQITEQAKLNTIARIAEDSLSMMQDLVSRKPISTITRAETLEILLSASQVFESLKVSEKLVDQLMNLKPVLFGGRSTLWTANDFGVAGAKVYQLKNLVERILPYKSVYTKTWNFRSINAGMGLSVSLDKEQEFFGSAEKALVRVADDLGALLESSYSYDHLQELVLEIETLYLSDSSANLEEWPLDRRAHKKELSLGETLTKFRGLFLKVKEIIYGRFKLPDNNPSPEIRKEEWKTFLNYASRGYSLSLFSHYFLNPFELDSSVGVRSTSRFVESALTIVSDILSQRKGWTLPDASPDQYGISIDEFGEIFAELRTHEILPKKIQVETMKGIMKALIGNFLISPRDRINKTPRTRFVDDSNEHLISEFRAWIQPEIFLAEKFEFSPLMTHSELKEVVKKFPEMIDPFAQDGFHELALALDTVIPVTTDEAGRMLITNQQVPLFNRKSAFYANLSRTIARLLIRSYTQESMLKFPQAGTVGEFPKDQHKCRTTDACEPLNKEQAKVAFEALRQPFIDLNLLDVNSTFLDSRFLEANLFVVRANGDMDYVNFLEFHDLIQMILSGLVNDSKLKGHLRRDCPIFMESQTVASPTGQGAVCQNVMKETVSFKCLRESYYSHSIQREMVGIPGYLKDMRTISESSWHEAFVNIVKATGWVPKGLPNVDQEMVDMNTLSLFPHLVQYLEMIFAKYDSNKDEFISIQELDLAYPTYKDLMLSLSKDRFVPFVFTEKDLPILFSYLVKYGKEPPSDFGQIGRCFGFQRFSFESIRCFKDALKGASKEVVQWVLWKTELFGKKREVNAGRSEIAKILGYISDKVSEPTKPHLNCAPTN